MDFPFNAVDVDDSAALHAEDAVNHQMALGPLIGRDAIRATFTVMAGLIVFQRGYRNRLSFPRLHNLPREE